MLKAKSVHVHFFLIFSVVGGPALIVNDDILKQHTEREKQQNEATTDNDVDSVVDGGAQSQEVQTH